MAEPVMAFDGFDLVPITSDDLPRIVAWRSLPEVHEWYGGRPVTEDEIRRRHLESPDPVTRCLVHLDGVPIGHLQYYEYRDEWKPAIGLRSSDEGVWGIDVYLGDPALHGKGIGTRLIRGVAETLVSDHGAVRVVIDPHVENVAAVRCYEKAGFRKVRILPSYERLRGAWRDAWLMEFTPQGFADCRGGGTLGGDMPPDPDSAPAIIEQSRLDTFKHWARRVTLASIFGNALLGIWAVAGDLDEIGSAVLATSLLLTAAGVTSVACAAAIPERRIGWLIPLIGIGASLAGYALLIAAAWDDFHTSVLWRLGGSLVALAVAVGYASLLSDVHLPGRYRRLLPTAYVLLAAITAVAVAVVWGWSPGEIWRFVVIMTVLLGAITIAAPVVERIRPAEAGAPEITHCPYCGEPARGRGMKGQCPACHRRFRVTEI